MYIAVDVGGTNIRVAGFGDPESLEYRGDPQRRLTSTDFDTDLRFIIEAAHDLSGAETIEAVGIAAPGVHDANNSRVVQAGTLRHWEGRPLTSVLSSHLEAPVYLEQDATVAAMGEAYIGKNNDDFHFLIWGSGIGGAEVKHDPNTGRPRFVSPDWEARFSHWTQDCQGDELRKAYSKPSEQLDESEWSQVMTLFESHLREYVETYLPQSIVFSGGIALRQAQAIREMGANMTDVMGATEDGYPISVSQFGPNSGLVGGLALIGDRRS